MSALAVPSDIEMVRHCANDYRRRALDFTADSLDACALSAQVLPKVTSALIAITERMANSSLYSTDPLTGETYYTLACEALAGL